MVRTEISKEFVEDLLRSQQDEIVRSMLDAVLALDEASSQAVLKEMAAGCLARFLRMVDIPVERGLDALLDRMRKAGPERVQISRSGNEIIWRELREGRCMCPLVRRNVVELQPKLCECSKEWTRGLVETFWGAPVEAEIVESVGMGSQDCVFRLTLGTASGKAA
jgi:hypothetical protein